MGREPGHVEGRGAAKPVDRLPRVSHGPEVPAGVGQLLEQPHAAAVHVLILVDEDVRVGSAKRGRRLWIAVEQRDRQRHEVAEIHGAGRLLQLLVSPVDERDLGAPLPRLAGVGVDGVEHQDRAGIDTVVDQPGNAPDERLRLAGTRSRLE